MTPVGLRIAVAAAAIALCYAGTVWVLANGWAASALYSYGFAVPLISGYVAWARIERLRSVASAPDYVLGVPLAVSAALLLLVGRLGALVTVQGASLIVALAASVLLLFGRATFKVLSFPILYLFLMIPIWTFPIERLTGPSQVLSGRIAAQFLHLVGVPALREGTTIALPEITLEIVPGCSGVSQLIVIIAMGLPVAYLFLEGFVRRAALMGAAVVIAYLSNGLRIAMVGFLAYKGLGSGNLREWHLVEGLVVSSAGYMLLGGCLVVLMRTQRSSGPRSASTPSPGEPAAPVHRPWFELTSLAALLVAGCYSFVFQPVDVDPGNALNSLPAQIGEWTVDTTAQAPAVRLPVIDDELVNNYPTPPVERRFTGVDDELVRTYRTTTGQRVGLYIGYHRNQRQGKELTGEAGHELNDAASRVALETDSRSGTIEINEVGQHARTGRGIFYWYVLNGRVVTDLYLVKTYSIWDALTRRRTNGAVIMVEWDCKDESRKDQCDARHMGINFVQALLPIVARHLPS